MPRRRKFLDDDDLDSSASERSEGLGGGDDFLDDDERAEAELFQDPYSRSRKRRRRHGDEDYNPKEDAIYGTFAHAEDEELQGRKAKGKGRSDPRLRRPQTFVPAGGPKPDHPTEELSPIADVDAEAENEQALDMSGNSSPLDQDMVPPAVEDEDTSLSCDEAAEGPDGVGLGVGRAGLGTRAIQGRTGLGAASGSPAAAANYAAAQLFSKAGLGSQGGGDNSVGAAKAGPGGRGGLGSAGRERQGLSSGGTGRAGLGGGGRGSDAARAPLGRDVLQASSTATSRDESMSPAVDGESPVPTRRAFLGSTSADPSSAAPKPKVPLSRSEQQHFTSLARSGGVGLKLLEKMGWKSGSGLGATGEGIVTPIETKLRPKGAGLNYEGFSERTKQAKEEDRRRGKHVSDSEDDESGGRRRKNKGKGKVVRGDEPMGRPDAWRRPLKPKKSAVIHKTYEEVLAESGSTPGVDSGLGQIVDLTGRTLPNLPSTLSTAISAPMEEERHSLPELRHNLRLLWDTTRGDLGALAREGKALEERKKWLQQTKETAATRATQLENKIERMEKVAELCEEVAKVSKEVNGVDEEPEELLARFDGGFNDLIGLYPEEFEEMRLDEVAVAAATPLLRRLWSTWQPLQQPNFLVAQLKRWRRVLRLRKLDPKDGQQLDTPDHLDARANGRTNASSDSKMTAFETLMWTQWLPRIRSSLNSWSPTQPQPLLDLYVAWQPLLPQFLRDNIFDQLILPRVFSAIEDWTPKSGGSSLHTIVFPWLQHAGEERMGEILDQARRRIRIWLKAWRPRDGVPQGLAAWKEVFSKNDWDSLMLRSVVPSLGSNLRDKFKVDPRNQDVEVLQRQTLPWRDLLRQSVLSQLLEAEFFPKWLDAVWIWLTHKPDYDQVAAWYKWWRSEFPEEVLTMKGVAAGFARCQEMIYQAASLSSQGVVVKERLARPDLQARPLSSPSSSRSGSRAGTPKPSKPTTSARQMEEVTFKSIVEEEAAKENLLVLPTGKSLPTTGAQLLRVSENVDGKNGITFYIEDDVAWVQEGGEWEPTIVADLLELAKRR